MFCILYFTFLFISPWAKSLEKLQVVKEPWPEMLFSPQLLGIHWIQNHEDKFGLVVIRMDQNNYLDALERAMVAGNLVLIEGARDTIYLVLEPLLSRQTVKKGRFTSGSNNLPLQKLV